MLNIPNFKIVASQNGYEEDKIFIAHPEETLKNFISYSDTTLELKIFLCELLIYRHFMATGAIILPDDINWFIEEYFKEYKKDLVDPIRTKAIIEAKDMIMSDDIFGKATVGRVFMFAVIEFYAKYKLGFRPHKYDFFDIEKYSFTKEFFDTKKPKHLYIGKALDLLETKDLPISRSLKSVNERGTNKMNELNIKEEKFVYHKISGRLSIVRNAMLHGEQFTFFDKGKYLLMLYILFQLNESLENSMTPQ